jgi:polyisoprenoid-binding protein YceI
MHRSRAVLALIALSTPAWLAAQVPRSKKVAASKPPAAQPIHLALAPAGNEARFVVREQLARAELPNDAIGSTTGITGEIVLDGKGGVDSAASRITVDLTTLKSDRDMRDRYIKRRTLVVDSFPQAQLVVTEVRGLPASLPTSGTLTFTLVGNLTVHGVTTRTTWEVTAQADGNEFTGTATTHVKFGDFGMQQPRVMMVLSVVDDLKLEYDFHFVRQPAGKP